jgi:hypothetical protein
MPAYSGHPAPSHMVYAQQQAYQPQGYPQPHAYPPQGQRAMQQHPAHAAHYPQPVYQVTCPAAAEAVFLLHC